MERLNKQPEPVVNPSFSVGTPFFEERRRSVEFPMPKNGFQINILSQKVDKFDD